MTTSLPLSKQLSEKGLKIETERTYCDVSGQWREEKSHFILHESDIAKARQQNESKELQYPAPSTDELLAVVDDTMVHIYLIQRYGIATSQSCLDLVRDIEALGKMICWLLSNGYHYNPEAKMIEVKK